MYQKQLSGGRTSKRHHTDQIWKVLRNICLSLGLIMVVMGGPFGCKSQNPVVEEDTEQSNAAAMQLAKAKATLESILSANYTSLDQVDAAERELDAIKAMGITDSEILSLIKRAEEKLANERDRLTALEKEQRAKQEAAAFEANLNGYFDEIAGASSLNIANMKIDQAMELFSTGDAPVLIIISSENGQNDYDRPTTIKKYLNYLKDQKKNPNLIENIVLDSRGKIKELELIKK